MHEITFLNIAFRDEETEIQRGHKEINRGNVDNDVDNKRGARIQVKGYLQRQLLLVILMALKVG